MSRCTGEQCPMQLGYDFERCAAVDKCPYRTWPATRADHIRSMSDQQLALFLTRVHFDGYCSWPDGASSTWSSKPKVMLEWLQQPWEDKT